MDKDILIPAIKECLDTGLVEYVYVRLSGRLTAASEILVLSGPDDISFSVKRGPMLGNPDIIAVDPATGEKKVSTADFADMIGKDVSVNCYLDRNNEWRAMDVSSKMIISK